MAIWLLLNEAVVLVLFCGISYCEDNIFENLKIKREDPPELVDFIQAILQQKDEFKKIRDAAKRYHIKTSESFFDQGDFLDGLESDKLNYSPEAQERSLILKRSPYDTNNYKRTRFSPNRPVNDIYPYMHNHEHETESHKDPFNLYERTDKKSARGDVKYRRFRKGKKPKGNRFRRGLDLNDYSSNRDFGSNNIKIIPRSEFGVRSVPGNKFGWVKSREPELNKAKSSEENNYINENEHLPENFRSDHHNQINLPNKVPVDNSITNKLPQELDEREKRLVEVQIEDNNNLIESIKLADVGQPLRLTIKNRNAQTKTASEAFLFHTSRYPYLSPDIKRFTNIPIFKPVRNSNSALFNSKIFHPSKYAKLHRNKNRNRPSVDSHKIPKKSNDNNGRSAEYQNEQNTVKTNISRMALNEEKVNRLEDVDEPTSAIEQHRLSTKPYYTSQPSNDDDIFLSTMDFPTPFAAFLFTASKSESITFKKPKHSDIKGIDPLFLGMGELSEFHNNQNLINKGVSHKIKFKTTDYISPLNNFKNKFYFRKQIDPKSFQNHYRDLDRSDLKQFNNQFREKDESSQNDHGLKQYNILARDNHLNHWGFQGRKLQSLYEVTDNGVISEGVPEEDTRYGELDYENGQHNYGINYSENKIRVKRIFPDIFSMDDDEQYSEDLTNDYKQSINLQRSEDDYDEDEDDPVVLKQGTYEKQARRNSESKYKDVENFENLYPADDATENNSTSACINRPKMDSQNTESINSIAELHSSDNLDTLQAEDEEKQSEQRNSRNNQCGCKKNSTKSINSIAELHSNDNLDTLQAEDEGKQSEQRNSRNNQCNCKKNSGCEKCGICKNCKAGNKGSPNYKACKTCHHHHHQGKIFDNDKETENGNEYSTKEPFLETLTEKSSLKHIRMQKNNRAESKMEEEDNDNDEMENCSEHYHTKKIIGNTTSLEVQGTPKQEAAEEEVQFKFKNLNSTNGTSTETSTCTTTTCTTTKTTTVTTTTPVSTKTTTQTRKTTTSCNPLHSTTAIILKSLVGMQNTKKRGKKQQNNNGKIRNHIKIKKGHSKLFGFKDDRNHLNINHKEETSYFHHPSKTRKPSHKKLKSDSPTKSRSTKSHLKEIFTHYHPKHNLNDFKGDNYKIKVEESTGQIHQDSDFVDFSQLETPIKDVTSKRGTCHKCKNHTTFDSDVTEIPDLETEYQFKTVKRNEKQDRNAAKRQNEDYENESYAEFSVNVDKLRGGKANMTRKEKEKHDFPLNIIDSIQTSKSVSSTGNINIEEINNHQTHETNLNSMTKKETNYMPLDNVESFADVVENDGNSKQINKRESNKRHRRFSNNRYRKIRNPNIINVPSITFSHIPYRRYIRGSSKYAEPAQLFEKTKVYSIPSYSGMNIEEKPSNEGDRFAYPNAYHPKRLIRKGQSANENEHSPDNANNKNMKQWINPQKTKSGGILSMDNLNDNPNDRKSPKKKVPTKEDSSQMHDAVNGHLASIIVDAIFDRVKNQPQLQNRFSYGLQKTHNGKNQIKNLDAFRNTETETDIKHTEEMLREIMTVLNKIILDQVTRRTCKRLSPELRHYLQTITINANQTSEEDEDGEDSYLLPPINSTKVQKSINPKQGTFLFNDQDTRSEAEKAAENVRKRITMVRELLARYRSMTAQSRVKVRDVEVYLKKHLTLLQDMLKVIEQDRRSWDRNPQTEHKPSRINTEFNSDVPFKSKHFASDKLLNDKLEPFNEKRDEQARKKFKDQPNNNLISPDLINDQRLNNFGAAPSRANGQPFNLDKILLDNYIKLQQNNEHSAVARSSKNVQPYLDYRDDDDVIDTYNESGEKSKSEQKREAAQSNGESLSDMEVSGQYKKLVQAADHLRKKKEIEERLGELFGNTKNRNIDNENYDTIKSLNREGPDLSKVAFEKPVVFQLEK